MIKHGCNEIKICLFFTVPTLSLQPGYSQQQPAFSQPQGSSQHQNYSKNAPTLSAPPKYDNIDKKMPVD